MRIALAAALVAATATPVFAAPVHGQFVQDGQRFAYNASRAGNGDVVLRGHTDLENFDLRVHNGAVEGTYGISPVSFKVTPETVAALDAQLNGQQAAAATSAALAAN